MKRLFIWGMLLCLLSGTAGAQQSASADVLIQDGLKVMQQIDRDAAGDAWENAAAFVKSRVPKDNFIKNMRQARSNIGQVSERRWASVVRIRFDKEIDGTPAGLYANIDYASDLSDGATVFELVSFQLDPQGVWRLTGYVPRNKQ